MLWSIYISKIVQRVENKVVLLMHDKMFATQFNGKEKFTNANHTFKNNGWKFENIEQYL